MSILVFMALPSRNIGMSLVQENYFRGVFEPVLPPTLQPGL
jgi:hypothetical protein